MGGTYVVYISDEHRFLFIHVPKTAGKSVMNALGTPPYAAHPLSLPMLEPHETAGEFCARNGIDVFNSYTSFCFVRHPLDRFISLYRFLLGRTEKIPFMKTITSIRPFIDSIINDVQVDILLPNKVDVKGMATLARPQVDFTRLLGFDVGINYVFRFEEIGPEWRNICAKLGVSPAPALPKINASVPHAIDDPDAARSFVRDYYRRDFDVFGYDQVKADSATLLI